MNIGNATAAQISSLVWTAATRTLTADPFTDAVGGAAVWTHAARTLTADPATDAGAATLVWTHATRTLTADPATDAGAATLVWGHAIRNLTTAPVFWVANEFAGIAPSSNNVQGSLGAYTQVIASCGHTVVEILLSVSPNTVVVNGALRIAIATGGAGSEVPFVNPVVANGTAGNSYAFRICVATTTIPKNSRIAIATANLTNATQVGCDIGISLLELND